MSRLKLISSESATGQAKELLEGVNAELGMVPNVVRAMASAPAVLDGYLHLCSSLASGTLSAKVRGQLALAISEANQSDYCVAAHSALGKMVGLTSDQIRDSRRGSAVDPRVDALIRFARKLVDARGQVSDADIRSVRHAGFDDFAIVEVVAGVALSIFTNYFNNVVGTEVDFPRPEALQPEPAATI